MTNYPIINYFILIGIKNIDSSGHRQQLDGVSVSEMKIFAVSFVVSFVMGTICLQILYKLSKHYLLQIARETEMLNQVADFMTS